jgi:hypothetical protein
MYSTKLIYKKVMSELITILFLKWLTIEGGKSNVVRWI